LLARSVVDADTATCTSLAPSVRQLADALTAMAADLGDRAIRQTAADDALAVARRLADTDPPSDPAVAATALAARMVTVDVMVVAGVPPDEAAAAVRRGRADELQVPAPPGTPRVPFILERRPRRRS
jgi:hypothetical protein